MASETGLFHECVKYAERHDLPVKWVVEDNGKSVCTDTREAWGTSGLECESEFVCPLSTTYYRYTLPWPHSGAGKRINF